MSAWSVAGRRGGLGLLAITVLSARATVAAAQEDPSTVAAARALGVEGVTMADAGNCKDAVDRLARAEQMHHAPTTLERLGECQIATGKLVDGTEALRRVIHETLPPDAPAVFVTAQERARKVLADAKPRLAQLKIAVASPPGTEYTVKVDGEVVPRANLNVNRPMDPGQHSVEVTGPRLLPATASVSLLEGKSDSVALTLQLDPNAPVLAAAGPESGPSPGSSATHRANNTAAWITLGAGGAGLVVGAVTGVLALSAKNDLTSNCHGNVCPGTEQSTLDSAKTKGTISTIGFIVGGVGVAGGLTLLLLKPFSSKTVGFAPYVAPGGGGLSGVF